MDNEEFRNQKTGRSARNPNNKMTYIRDENLLAVRELLNFSGFVNWCVSQKALREEFNNKVKK